MENLIRIQPDSERARSLLKLAKLRYSKIQTFDMEMESSLRAEGHYETMKELITALLFLDGYKTFSHVSLIAYLGKTDATDFPAADMALIDQLREWRNRIVYYGKFIEPSFLQRNAKQIASVTERLFQLVEQRLS